MLFLAARRRLLPALAAAALALALAGCSFLPKPGPDPTRHYVLTNSDAAAPGAGAPKSALRVGLRSIEMAPYLEGKSMIVRRGENEIDYRDFARWAEPLPVGINRVLMTRLHESGRLGRIFPQPFPFDEPRDVDISLNILRCEGRVHPDGSATVSFTCELEILRVSETSGAKGARVLFREVFKAPEIPWKDGDYAALAAGLSKSVSQLADHILAALPES